MPKIERFEDIRSWQIAKNLVKLIYCLTEKGKFKNDFGLKQQVQRCSVSIMANIAEGFERYSKKEFIQFLVVAKGSAGELRSHLYVALELSYLNEKEFKEAKDLCEYVSKSIWNFIRYLKKT